MFKRVKKLAAFVIMAAFVLQSCSKPISSERDGSASDAFNTSGIMPWAIGRPNIAATEDALYFIMDGYLFFTDLNTWKTRPLCFKVGCRHYKEMNGLKVTNCDAWVFSDQNKAQWSSFLGIYGNKLYAECCTKTPDLTPQLIEMNLDGSGWRVIMEDTRSVDADSMIIDEGTVYYTTYAKKEDQEFCHQLQKIDVTAGKRTPEVVYEIDEGRRIYIYRDYIPYKGWLFLNERGRGTSPVGNIVCYDMKSKEKKVLVEQEICSILGMNDGKLVYSVYHPSDHIEPHEVMEYSPEEDKAVRSARLNRPEEKKDDGMSWDPGCITKDFALNMTMGLDENGVTDLDHASFEVIDGEGRIALEVPFLSEDLDLNLGLQIMSIRGEEYLVMRSGDHTVDLLKKDDLLQGKTVPERRLLYGDRVGGGVDFIIK